MSRIALGVIVGTLALAGTPTSIQGDSQIGSSKRGYVPTTSEECFGTWINEKTRPQRIVLGPGPSNTIQVRDFQNVADESALREVMLEVDRKWTDADGVVWYRSYDTITSGLGHSEKVQSLHRLSKSGQVLEQVHVHVHQFGPESFPATVETSGAGYHIFYRAKG